MGGVVLNTVLDLDCVLLDFLTKTDPLRIGLEPTTYGLEVHRATFAPPEFALNQQQNY